MIDFSLTHWPADSRRMTQLFGENVERYRAKLGIEGGHNGVDIAISNGDPIYAAAPGTVVKVWRDPDPAMEPYGRHIIINHGQYETRYAHLLEIQVVEGDRVPGGQLIALGDNSGWSTGPHLHFEIRHHADAVDPWPFLWPLAGIQQSALDRMAGWIWLPGLIAQTGHAGVYGLNLRTRPSTGAQLVRYLPPGTLLMVLGDKVNQYVPVALVMPDPAGEGDP